jgi:aryl-alcohol dehydrogenase-like predicted oxidoreductase
MQKVLQTALSAGLSATEGIHSSKPKPVPKDFDGMQYVQPSSFVPNPQERITLKGKYAEVQISFLSIGAWSWGDTATWHWRDDELPALQEAWRTLVEGGINYIDTAQAYGSGKSEEICGELVQGLPRESYVMQTKYYVVPQPKNIVSPSGDVVSALEKSLKRMNLDCMDVYMVHGPIHPGTYAAVAKGLNECVEKKLCKVVAVANYDEKDMIKMYDALQEYGMSVLS